MLENGPGEFPPSDVAVVRKWEVEEEDGRADALKPTFTSSFTGFIETLRDGEDPFATLDVTGSLDPEAFFPRAGYADALPIGKGPQQYAVKDIDGKRFQIVINGGRGRVVFMPAPNDYTGAPPAPERRETGVWTTPFGPESELLLYIGRMMREDGRNDLPAWPDARYLHHDVKSRRHFGVALAPSFPEAHRPLVAKALAQWNAALGKEWFRLDPKGAQTDPGACVSGFQLCLGWTGDQGIPMTGLSAFTELGFDPQSGLITGAVITVVNDVKESTLVPLTAEEAKRFSGKGDLDAAAQAMTRYGEYEKKRHVDPKGYLEYLLLHEMGHVNGLAHNFFADPATHPAEPTSTVMTYVPFPVAHRASRIGPLDRERIDLVYKGREATTAEVSYCSTFATLVPARDGDYVRKSPRCDLFTVGNPADWYVRIAKHARYGVFTEYPDTSHLPEPLRRALRDANERRRMPPLNVLTHLGYVLSERVSVSLKDQDAVRAFLCGLKADRLAIEAQLRAHHGLDLRCMDR